MTVNYTTNLALGQPVTGTESGTWGDDVNNAVTSYLDIAIAGGLSVAITTADVTLTLTQGTSSATNIGSTTAQYAILNITGAKTAARNLIVPSSSRYYLINNAAATGGFLLTVKGTATSGVTLVDGEKAIVAWNGTDYVKVVSSAISNLTGTLPVANGGTGLTAGTSGGVLYYSASGTLASSAALAASAIVLGGGAGVTPATTTTGTGVVTALGANVGNAGAVVVNGGALGTPSSGTVTNLTGTASININGTVGATTANTGAFTTLSATGNTTLGDAVTDTMTFNGQFVTGTVLRSAQTATNTLALAAYDVDGTAYVNLITLTASNTPTLALTSTGVGTINNMSVGATTASTGAFTSLTSTSASGILTRAAATQDGVEFIGRAGGTTSLKVTFTPTTLTASRTLTLPDNTGTLLTTGAAVTVAQGGTGQTTAGAAFNALSPITSTGDLIIGNGVNSATRLGIGANGYILSSNGTTASWTAPAGGGASISNDTATSTNVYPLFAAATSGTPTTIYTGNAKYLYKPSTGELTSSAMISSNGIQINANTIATSYTIATGNNGLSAGPVSVSTGITVTVSTGSVWTVV